MATTQRIVCPDCGRSGPYRPELAGKRLKCKCGGVIQVPAQDSAEEGTEEPLRPEPIGSAPVAGKSDAADDPEAGYDIREPDEAPKGTRARPPDVLTYRAGAAATPPEPAAETYPTFARPKIYSTDNSAEKSQLIRLAVILAVIAVAIGGSIFGIRMLKGSGPTGPQLGEDADIQAKMQDEYCKEIHAWFQEDSTRIMGPWSESQALSHADQWQQMGAKQVLALGSRLSMVAVIELPDDPAKRKALFDWQAEWHRNHLTKVWTDVGQKYLMIRLGV